MTKSINLPNITAGSDLLLTLTMTQPPIGADPPQPFDLTGRTVVVFGEQPSLLAGRVSATIVNETEGTFTIRLEGSDPLPLGTYRWRVQFNLVNGDSISLPVFLLVII